MARNLDVRRDAPESSRPTRQRTLSALRWLLVAPVAVAIVPLVDTIVVAFLERLGAVDRSGTWLAGKVVGHLIMGALAVGLGTLIAPAYKRATAAVLLAVAVVVASVALLSGELPFRLIGPLATALVLGAASSAVFVLRREANATHDNFVPTKSSG